MDLKGKVCVISSLFTVVFIDNRSDKKPICADLLCALVFGYLYLLAPKWFEIFLCGLTTEIIKAYYKL